MSARVERKKPLNLGCRMNFKLKQKKILFGGYAPKRVLFGGYAPKRVNTT